MIKFINKYKDLLKSDMRWHLLREKSVIKYPVNLDEFKIKFYCTSLKELNRAKSVLTKEPGTVNWIKKDIKEGEVFYDIGANIGVYSLIAAKIVKEKGQVYSFEPHAFNFASLLKNISLNNLQSIISPMSISLNDETRFDKFYYKTLIIGSSNSQLSSNINSIGNDFKPEITQLMPAYNIDYLIDNNIIKRPDHIKIDVDGIEINIIHGMKKLLKSNFVKSIQVEINLPIKNQVVNFMEECGYKVKEKHFTSGGQRRIDMGMDPENYPYNIIFSKK